MDENVKFVMILNYVLFVVNSRKALPFSSFTFKRMQ